MSNFVQSEKSMLVRKSAEPANTLPATIATGESPAGAVTWQELASCSTARARQTVDPEIAMRIPVLPLGVHETGGKQLLIAAFSQNVSPSLLQEVRFACGMDVIAEEVDREVLIRAIHAAYFGHAAEVSDAALLVSQEFFAPAPVPAAAALQEAAVPKLIDRIIHRALLLGASDVHIEPQYDFVRVRYRRNGVLTEDNGVKVDSSAAPYLSRRIKVLAGLDLTAKHGAQDGAFSFVVAGAEVRVRVSAVPQFYGEKIVLRLLDNSAWSFDCEDATGSGQLCRLGLNLNQARELLAGIAGDRGSILVTGPTGSGKSTLLYLLMQFLNSRSRNLISLEDPVERIIPGVNQIPVDFGEADGFIRLLRAALRQDPDALMIGEIRDKDTADTVLTAGITGMLVLSTIHAGSCLEVFTRLRQIGVAPELLSMSLRLIVSQRLAGINCIHCRVAAAPQPHIVRLFQLAPDDTVQISQGCGRCRGGIAGRIGVFEILPLHDRLRSALRWLDHPEGNTHAIREQFIEEAVQCGYQPLAYAVRDALLAGTISPNAAIEAMGINPDILDLM